MLLLCIYISNQIKAQTLDTAPWCPPGATWVYWLQGGFGRIEYLKISYEKDTIISDQNVKKLNASIIKYYSINPILGRIENFFATTYEYISNDSLYFYDASKDSFLLKYDFNAAQSNSLITNKLSPWAVCSSDTTFPSVDTFNVLSTDQDTLANLIFPCIQFDDNITDNYFIGKILKNIGSYTSFYPEINYSLCFDSYLKYRGLVYYEDSLREVVLTSANEPIANILPIERSSMQAEETSRANSFLKAYPNPSTNLLWVDYHGKLHLSYELYDISGNIVDSGQLQERCINVQELPSGIYFIRFYTDKLVQFYSKFIKN